MLVSVLSTSEVRAATVLRACLANFDIHAFTKDGIEEREVSDREVHHVFHTTLTPRFIVDLIEELVETHALARVDARVIERSILACVDRQGQWRAL